MSGLTKMCVLYEEKLCDECGECLRCELDPKKLCDNCGKCIALDDETEYRSIVVDREGMSVQNIPEVGDTVREKVDSRPVWESGEEPTELTPELVAYWERILIEHGEAPADDGLGELELPIRKPVRGKRKK